jgi:hypothetical protein
MKLLMSRVAVASMVLGPAALVRVISIQLVLWKAGHPKQPLYRLAHASVLRAKVSRRMMRTMIIILTASILGVVTYQLSKMLLMRKMVY